MKRTVLQRTWLSFLVSLGVIAVCTVTHFVFPDLFPLSGTQGVSLFVLMASVAAVWCAASLLTLGTVYTMQQRGRPDSEALMIGRLFRLVSIFVIALVVAGAYDKLGTFGTLFSLFGGMLLGWSLQAPVSGLAAWVLVNVKRPFRPGDRVQFPNLGLTGDVKEIGAMYVVLDQVGGTVGSEEAVGRHVLVPNAMLFSQVVINFTVKQEAAYMLDEVVVRITYDSDLDVAERILIDAAKKITGDIIRVTGSQPYIRSDLYDYGVYLRLRFQTHVQDRARIAYEINKEILKAIQHTRSVDLAIPFIYSYRAGLAETVRKENEDEAAAREPKDVREVEMSQINDTTSDSDPEAVERLSRSIGISGLLQPVVLARAPGQNSYHIIAGHLRYAACKHLGWKTIPAVISSGLAESRGPEGRRANSRKARDDGSLNLGLE